MTRFTSNTEQMPLFIAVTGMKQRMAKFIGWSLLSLAYLGMLTGSMPAAAQKKAQAQLQVTATILTMIKVKVVSQPGQINIEQKHIAQGYIDIEDASVLLITSNSPDGFMMSLSHDPAMVSSVSARLSQGGNTAEGESMISVHTQQVRDEPMRVSYRLHLNPQAHVGSQPWPVALSFTPRAV